MRSPCTRRRTPRRAYSAGSGGSRCREVSTFRYSLVTADAVWASGMRWRADAPGARQFAVDERLVALLGARGQDGDAMEITELPLTPLVLPSAGELVLVRTQEWALERWDGEDPPGPAVPWARKPKFSLEGSRSYAELAIVHHLRAGGWDGVAFFQAKVGPDRIKPTSSGSWRSDCASAAWTTSRSSRSPCPPRAGRRPASPVLLRAPSTSAHAAWSAFGAGAGQDHSSGAGYPSVRVRANPPIWRRYEEAEVIGSTTREWVSWVSAAVRPDAGVAPCSLPAPSGWLPIRRGLTGRDVASEAAGQGLHAARGPRGGEGAGVICQAVRLSPAVYAAQRTSGAGPLALQPDRSAQHTAGDGMR